MNENIHNNSIIYYTRVGEGGGKKEVREGTNLSTKKEMIKYIFRYCLWGILFRSYKRKREMKWPNIHIKLKIQKNYQLTIVITFMFFKSFSISV